jgi:hypothetical protein
MKTLNYLDSFWQKAKLAVNEIETELPKVASEDILKPLGTSGKMWTIQYKDLGNNWGVKELLQRHNGESNNLTLLTDKVKDLFQKSPDKITEFLIATANKGYFVRKSCFSSDRENSTVIKLTPNELTRLKLYIQENL